MGLFRSWSPRIFHWWFCIQNQQSPSTSGAFSEVVFEIEWRATYFGSLGAKLVLAPLGMPKWVWPSMNQYRMIFIQTPHSLQECTQNLLNMEGIVCKIANFLPKSHVDELEDNFIKKQMRTWTFWGSLIQYPSNFCESGIMAMVTWGLPCMKDPLHGGVKPWLKPTCLMRPSNLPDLHRFFHLEEDRQAWPQQSKPEPELPHWALGSQARVPSYHSVKTPNLLGYFNHISSQKESYQVTIKIRHSHRISLANRVILYLINMTIGRELVVLQTTPSMFG